jgi:protein O-mannosyl-transferase
LLASAEISAKNPIFASILPEYIHAFFTAQKLTAQKRRMNSRQTKTEPRTASGTAQKPVSPFRLANPVVQACLLALLCFVLYGKTLTFKEFVADDTMVILGNKYVQQGVKGIPEILAHDSFYGFDSQFDRQNTRKTYRPLSFVTFAIEKSLFDSSMKAAHAIHLALYICAVLALWNALRRLLAGSASITDSPQHPATYHALLPFFAALLFAAHPLHTEVVANIKSRDELLAFLFLALSLNFLLKSLSPLSTSRSDQAREQAGEQARASLPELAASVGCFALALLSKESAVTFAPVFGLAVWLVVPPIERLHSLRQTAPHLVLAVVYLIVWFGVFGAVDEAMYARVRNNPFAEASIGGALATKTAVLALAILKVFYPTTLSTGYTFNQIPLMGWTTHWEPLAGLLLIAALLVLALWLLRERGMNVISFAILGFFCTMAIASNFIIYAGGLLGERFLFTPSAFAMLAVAWLLVRAGEIGTLFTQGNTKKRPTSQRSTSQRQTSLTRIGIAALVLLSGVYSLRTMSRTNDWESTYTLLRADTQSTPNSLWLRQMYAGLLLQAAPNRRQINTEAAILQEAHENLQAALRLDSTLPSLYSGLGSYYGQLGKRDSAVFFYEKARSLDAASSVYAFNLANAYAARGMEIVINGDTAQGVTLFRRAVALDSLNATAHSNIGIIFRLQHRYDSAAPYLRTALRLNPSLAKARKSLQIVEQELRK